METALFEVEIPNISAETARELQNYESLIQEALCGARSDEFHQDCRLAAAFGLVYRPGRTLYWFQGDYWFTGIEEATARAIAASRALARAGATADAPTLKQYVMV